MPVNIYDAKTQLSRLISRVEDGGEVILARRGKPVAKLVGIAPQKRPLGFDRDRLELPDDLDQPLPAEETEGFYQSALIPKPRGSKPGRSKAGRQGKTKR